MAKQAKKSKTAAKKAASLPAGKAGKKSAKKATAKKAIKKSGSAKAKPQRKPLGKPLDFVPFRSMFSVMGLQEDVSVLNNNETTAFFTYAFNPAGFLVINQVATFNATAINRPLETHVGQFGLYATGHSASRPSLITNASIIYNLFCSCDSTIVNIREYGEELFFSDAVGKPVIDVFRSVKLVEIITDAHKALHAENSSCPLLSDLKNNPMLATQKVINIRLDMIFEVKNKSGRTTKSIIKLKLIPVRIEQITL